MRKNEYRAWLLVSASSMLVQNKKIQHMQLLCSPRRRQRSWYGPRRAQGGYSPTGLLAPSAFEQVLAPGPGLRSPHSSLLSTQQNRLFQEKVAPPEKMFLHALEALALHVVPAISRDRAWTPPCTTTTLFQVRILTSHKRQCVRSEQLLS